MTEPIAVDDRTSALAGLEGILFLAAEPVTLEDLSQALEVGTDQVQELLDELSTSLTRRHSGLGVRNAGGGWRLYTSEVGTEHVERFVLAGKSGRLSQAALETLGVIAYKQPISRSDIGEVRGVNVDGAVRSLAARGLITEVGRDDGPGQAVLYGTTQDFLVKLGIDRLDDLPPLSDYLFDEDAPDEPAPDQLRAARKLLRLGQRLPSTGAARWTPDGELAEDEDDLEDHDEDRDEVVDEAQRAAAERLAARTANVVRRRDDEAVMDDLTGRMETAASAAMASLQTAVDAVEQDQADDEVDDEVDDEPVDEVDDAAADTDVESDDE